MPGYLFCEDMATLLFLDSLMISISINSQAKENIADIKPAIDTDEKTLSPKNNHLLTKETGR